MAQGHTWTIERELCTLSGTNDVHSALFSLGLAKPEWQDLTIHCLGEWHRGGSETYILEFNILSEGLVKTRAILKACTPPPSITDLSIVLDTWISRRSILTSAGISVPILYYSGSGLLVEEFIEHALETVLKSATDLHDFILQLATLAGVFQRLHFHCLSPFSDLRSRGNDVVVIDFGSDLGSPDQPLADPTKYYHDLANWLEQIGIRLDSEQTRELERVFELSRESAPAQIYS